MLTIIVLLICSVIGILLSVWFINNDYDGCLFVIGVITTICIAFLVGNVWSVIDENVVKDATIAKYEERYKTLTYQVENFNTLYANSAANDKKELLNDVQEWNEDIAYGLKMHNNPWKNWMYPIDYTQFKFIEMPVIEGK